MAARLQINIWRGDRGAGAQERREQPIGEQEMGVEGKIM